MVYSDLYIKICIFVFLLLMGNRMNNTKGEVVLMMSSLWHDVALLFFLFLPLTLLCLESLKWLTFSVDKNEMCRMQRLIRIFIISN